MPEVPFTLALIAGGVAGTTVDVALHPLDTLRTRLQSKEGFFKSGGFKGTYKGLGSAALGSAPGAALFFSTYETAKTVFKGFAGDQEHWTHHAASSSCGEVMACLVRVPTAVVTQNQQVGRYANTMEAVSSTIKAGGLGAFYVGYGTTVMREIPFSFIQFPIYEQFKKSLSGFLGRETGPIEGAACGSVAGAIAGGLTCPLDCAKTRIMLEKPAEGEAKRYTGTVQTLKLLATEEGIPGLFRGLSARVTWITIGGFIFFGAYEGCQVGLWKTGAWGVRPAE
jgi:solute carrier family 25 S-adenosylmethionine transporter 26